MQLHTNNLVLLVLALAIIAVVMLMGGYYNTAAQGTTDSACSSEVMLRAATTTLDLGPEETLENCKTQSVAFDADASDKHMRAEILQGYLRCKNQFASALDNDILSEANTFCHACAVYTKPGGGEVTGVPEAINNYEDFTPTDERQRFLEPTARQETQEVTFSLDEPLGIYFVQDKTTTLADLFTPSVGAGTGTAVAAVLAYSGPVGWIAGVVMIGGGLAAGYVAGHYVGGDGETLSAIVIRPYTEETLDTLGCTTTTVEDA